MKLYLSQSEAMEDNHPTLYSDASEVIDLGKASEGPDYVSVVSDYVSVVYNSIRDPNGNDIQVYLHSETGLWVAPSGVQYSDITIFSDSDDETNDEIMDKTPQ